MNTLNDQANAEDFDVLRKAIVRRCYNVCLDLAQERWDQFKGRSASKAFIGNPHTEGISDGASECADAILEAFGLTEKDL